MNHIQTDHDTVLRLCNGNTEAANWIQIGHHYVHEIDDLIDVDLAKGDRATGAERACKIGALALALYTHPFFLKHMATLKAAMLANTLAYVDSVLWEESKVPWQKAYSDFARHGWIEVTLMVSVICGGYDAARNESQQLRTIAYADHHDISGQSH